VLAVCKHNLAGVLPASLRYTFEPADWGVARVGWCGESPHTADELVAPKQKHIAEGGERILKIDVARDLMKRLLDERPDGILGKSEALEEGSAAGCSARIIEQVAEEMKLKIHWRPCPEGRLYYWRREPVREVRSTK
jgi:hypothetical protein